MLFGWFRSRIADSSYAVYGSIVAQARQPAFYLDYAVPDTVEGRFEMILVHIALLFDRLKDEDAPIRAGAQEVLDLFFADMDRSLREMGVGDLSMKKKMTKLGQAYNGRALAYGRAAGEGAPALAAAFLKNVWAGRSGPAEAAGAARLARYALATAASLKASPPRTLLDAAIPWPDPADVRPEGAEP
ncbi:ubiquinol-cytochrome C chaperone family protein [Prosthecomicrobium sp. N25]|uniref:ubiquinol-cytochrome C chaperone family protein n=1 Tax=Prosthecomicrobium sp. N25 TaxID=3129254 RepID=UPI003077BFB0